MKKLLVSLLLILSSVVSAQQVNSETGNIVYTTLNPPPAGSPHTWNGFINYNTGGGGLQGGNIPAYNSNTGTFIFGYMQGTVNYALAVNFALANAGTGIQVNGLKYSWEYFNQDYSRGTLSGNISLTNKSGSVVENYNFNMPQTTQGWTVMAGTKNFNTQYDPSNLGNLQVSFTGKDDRFWAGYYGPQIRDIDVRFLYSIIPPPIPDFSQWIKLTDENGTFTLTKSGTVRYGAQGTYIYQTYEPGTYECSNNAWGKDPIGGVYKACDLGSNTTTPTLPTTNNTASNTTTSVTNSIIAQAAEPVANTNTALVSPTTTSTASTVEPIKESTNTVSTTSNVINASPTVTSTVSPVVAVVQVATPVTNQQTSNTKENNVSSPSLSNVLNMIRTNERKEQAIAQSAISQANEVAQSAVTQTEQTALSVSATSNSLSIESAKLTSNSTENNSTKKETLGSMESQFSTNLNSIQSPLKSTAQTVNNISNISNNTLPNQSSVSVAIVNSTYSLLPNQVSKPQEITNNYNINSTNTTIATQQNNNTSNRNLTSFSLENNSSVTIVKPNIPNFGNTQTVTVESNVYKPYNYIAPTSSLIMSENNNPSIQKLNVEPVATNYDISNNTVSFTKPGDVIQSQIENNGMLNNNTLVENKNVSVKANTQDNDIAGNITIASLGTGPTNFASYTNLVLQDTVFYLPKEIYRNQRVIDNARALRQLSSDRLHKELVEQQYRRNANE